MCRLPQIAVIMLGVFFGACRDSGSDLSITSQTPSTEGNQRLQRQRAEQDELRKPTEGLSEADLFREYQVALSEKRRSMIRGELIRSGSLAAAAKLDTMAAEIDNPKEQFPLLNSATRIRSRILQTRPARLDEIRISMMRIGHDWFPASSRWAVDTAAKEGLVELRDEVHAVATFDPYPAAREAARQSLVVLDLWSVGRSAEETFVLAVERGDLALKEWALLQLKELPTLSPASLARVAAATSPLLTEAERRANRFLPTLEGDVAMGYPANGFRTENTVEDHRIQCSMRAFWEKHDPKALSAAYERNGIPQGPMTCREYQ